ncbi:773_t:CDS:2 [Ambispora leptoticha]|uniref:773_t:CDS:1 n=1 Tax=Ambispora leptoticha TaxID=144679 RepID=A0A9N9FUX5_9GLOM|nr:773_t:CDS:2 [Ambispora leptoticha]
MSEIQNLIFERESEDSGDDLRKSSEQRLLTSSLKSDNVPLLNHENVMVYINGDGNYLVNTFAVHSNENHQNNDRIGHHGIQNPNSRNHSDLLDKNPEVIDLTKDDDADKDNSSLIDLAKTRDKDDTEDSFRRQTINFSQSSPIFNNYRDLHFYRKTFALRQDSPRFNLNFIYIRDPFFDASSLPHIMDENWHTRDKKEYTIRGRTIWALAMTDIIYHTLPYAYPATIHAMFYNVMKPEIFDELWRTNSHPGDFWMFNFAYYREVGVDRLIYYLKCLLQPIANKLLILREIGVVDRRLAVTRYFWNI